jgi:hypothetical protein
VAAGRQRVSLSEITQRQRLTVQKTEIIDREPHRCDFVQLPFLLLEDVAAGRVQPTAVVLYLHYKRVAWQNHGNPVIETLRETKQQTGLSNGTILLARDSLATTGWIQLEIQGGTHHEVVRVEVLDRWVENCPGHDSHGGQILTTGSLGGRKPATGGQNPATGGRKPATTELENALKTPVEIKDSSNNSDCVPVVDDEAAVGQEGVVPLLAHVESPIHGEGGSPEALVTAVYRGQGADPSDLTPAIWRRELAIARDLVEKGATPDEAEEFARWACTDPTRLASIDMRAFERERVPWAAKRRRPSRDPQRSGYEWEPFQGTRLPIAEADLARGAVL